MIRSLRIPAFVLLICLGSTFAFTQNAPTPGNRPKLGLVFEGGGALGLAHIGVIQYLEEHHIPVSYIAGTSMGGLVGGVYATGRNAAEVRDVVKAINWDVVISGQTPFSDLSYRRKEDAEEYPSTLEFGMHKGLQFPAGFNAGQQVDLILDHIALPYSGLKSFNDLPIPFACVATDLVEGQEHIFRDGPLELALRSTMSLPGIFTPVHYKGHIFVDGGLMNNFPVSVAKAMGADQVLGIYLQTEPLKPDATLSSFGVLGQSISVMIAANERTALKDADILVKVPLLKYTSMSYNDADAIIKAGYDAAASHADQLAPLSVDEASWRKYLDERDARRIRATAAPQFVQVTGVDPQIAKSMATEMNGFVGKPIDIATLDRQMLRFNGQGAFLSLNYSVVQKDGQTGLEIDAQPKPYSPPIVRPLILINGSDYNEVFFSMGARATWNNFGGYRRELRADVTVGSQYQIFGEYYRPFDPLSRWFVAPRVNLSSFQYPIYNGDNTLLSIYRQREALGGFDLGYAFGRSGELRLGYEGGYAKLSPQVGNSSELPTVDGGTGDVRLQYVFTTLDEPVVPRKGESVKFFTKYYNANPGAPEGFPLSELSIQNFFKISKPSSVFLNAYGGTSYGFKTGIPAFNLGGPTRWAAYGENELLTNQYFLFQAGYIRTLKNLPPLLGSTIDFIGEFEIGKTYQLPNGPKPPYLPGDIVGALIVNTLFGPVEVGGAVGNYGHAKFFFQVGRVF